MQSAALEANSSFVTQEVNRILWHPKVHAAMNVGPCHHGMARPQVADGGTAAYMEGSCE
jgi:hypothetical protein